ncbi:MAG: transporter substrate-binding domain-containing protein [Saccharospirillaceae bacterium]|nr:transporter substrate-binding domain-containing protein [Saccharospirillaceae bacterium]MCD8531455.1 transporter substrate-binding domain-containing protein [Saccharospirillaceae bacterium]
MSLLLRSFLSSLPAVVFCLLTPATFAQSADAVRVGCGDSIPPYVIRQNDRGIVLDILRRALLTQNKTLDVRYNNNTNNVIAFNDGELDIACITSSSASPGAFFSRQPLIVFHNIAISLSSRKVLLNDVSNLGNYRIDAFNLASQLLPEQFTAEAARSPAYRERSDQKQQVEALFRGDTDVIIMEQTIFRYFLSQLRRADPNNPRYQQQYQYHDLFAPNYYYAAFRSKQLRDSFDMGMNLLTDSGELDKILQSYERLLADYLIR